MLPRWVSRNPHLANMNQIMARTSAVQHSVAGGLLRCFLRLSDGADGNKKSPNTALHELHLSDASIDVLRTGKFNHRLLSELICHKDFQRFMLDAEIFVAPPFPTKSLILRGAPSASRILLLKNPAFVSPWCHKIRLSYCRRKVSVNRYLPVKQMAKPAPFLRQPEAKV